LKAGTFSRLLKLLKFHFEIKTTAKDIFNFLKTTYSAQSILISITVKFLVNVLGYVYFSRPQTDKNLQIKV